MTPGAPAPAWRRAVTWLGLALIAIALGLGIGGTPAWAGLPAGNAITDGRAILRYALPINNPAAREIQGNLEALSEYLRSKRWSPVQSKVKAVSRSLTYRRDDLLATVPEARQDEMSALLDRMTEEVAALQEAVKIHDREAVWLGRRSLLDQVGELETSMVTEFPYAVPEDYANLPQLKGRATVEVVTTQGPVRVVLDGYSAPVTAGNFVDLVQRGFYDGLPFVRAENSYVLQFGDPAGEAEGFIDPKTGQYRAIPLEVLVNGDTEPTYGDTLEALGRYNELPVLPFSAYGALALARPEPDPNGGSSQVFFFLFDTELTPPGFNLLDGRYAVFGYTVDGQDVLASLRQDDRIESIRVIDGLENLVEPPNA